MANNSCAEVAEVVVKWLQMRLIGPAFESRQLTNNYSN